MNIYKILEALKGVEESVMSEIDQLYHEWLNSEYAPYDSDAGDDREVMRKAASFLHGTVAPEHIEAYSAEMARAYHGGLYEAGYPFAGQAVGQKPGDQVRGKEAFKTGGKEHPAKGRLVGASESVEMECGNSMSPLEKKLRARWEQTKAGLQEYGMTTGGTTNPTANTATDPAAQAKDATIAKTNLNKLTQMGINPTQATKAIANIETDPQKPLGSADLAQTKALTDLVGDALSDPQKGGQLSTILQQVAKGK